MSDAKGIQLAPGDVIGLWTASGQQRTMLVIDEAKLLALRGKNDPLGILNRLATEARKYGLGLLLASQDLEHFTRDILWRRGSCRRCGSPLWGW